MSSTTDRFKVRRGRELGQVLPIFAFGLIGIIAVAALVFDVGQNLFERRKQQDAADAAALAGARWMTEAACKSNPNRISCPKAVDAAEKIATRHGYDISQVQVNIPPIATSQFAGFPGHIQVTITSERDSYFAGALGIATSRISAMGVAANIDGYSLPYSFLALGKDCNKDGWVTGNGTMLIEGDVMVTGDCDPTDGALAFDGGALALSVGGACSTTGALDYGPGVSDPACDGGDSADVDPISDPLSGLQPPFVGGGAVPDPPRTPDIESGSVVANKFNKCPGQSQAATSANPVTCEIGPNSNGTNEVRIYPGVYYGGLILNEGGGAKHLVVYMEPGIYYMAGGGFLVSGDVEVITVDPGGTSYGTSAAAGIMIFNSHNPKDFAACEAGTSGGDRCIRSVDFQNTSGVKIHGYTGPVYTSLIVFQDRRVANQTNVPVKLTGNSSMIIEGTFYLPEAAFEYSGNGSGEVLNAQVISKTFKVSGGGSLTISYDPDEALKLRGIGLVQ